MRITKISTPTLDLNDKNTILARRVRELRFEKGWGPDDLASRAKISRTALYQIETCKTNRPRAVTLRNIAKAFGVDASELFRTPESEGSQIHEGIDSTMNQGSDFDGIDQNHGRAANEQPFMPTRAATPPSADGLEPPRWLRDLELESKFRCILSSPFRDGVARIVEQTYLLIPLEQRYGSK